MPTVADRTGERFGMLTVVRRAEDKYLSSGRKVIQWLCLCDCGNYKVVAWSHLHNGDVVSCGCYHKQRLQESVRERNTKHMQSRTRLYHLYESMKYRCNNPNATAYDAYGGRGIMMCDEWNRKDGFDVFYEWAVTNGYSDDLTIDRIDVNGNYEPSNCRWVDSETQHNNAQNSIKLTYEGKTMTAAQWARELGLNRNTVYWRIRKGLPVEMVLGPKLR